MTLFKILDKYFLQYNPSYNIYEEKDDFNIYLCLDIPSILITL